MHYHMFQTKRSNVRWSAISLALILMLAGFALSGCNSQSGPGESGNSGAAAGPTISPGSQQQTTGSGFSALDGNCGSTANDQADKIQHLCGWKNGILVWQNPDQYSHVIGALGSSDQPTGKSACNQGYKWFQVSSAQGYPWPDSQSTTPLGWVADNGVNACPLGYTGSNPADFGGGPPPWGSSSGP